MLFHFSLYNNISTILDKINLIALSNNVRFYLEKNSSINKSNFKKINKKFS